MVGVRFFFGNTGLEELLDTTFVNSVDVNSLAFFIPLIVRGMREGNAEVTHAAATTAGNICSLVNEVSDLVPFVPQLLPELARRLEKCHTPTT